MFQNKLLLRFDPVSIREATLRRSKKQGSKCKTSPAKSFAAQKDLHVETVETPCLILDDDEENLDDMIQRVNSKIEQLIESVPDELPESVPDSLELKPNAPALRPSTLHYPVKANAVQLALSSPHSPAREHAYDLSSPHSPKRDYVYERRNPSIELAMEIEERIAELHNLGLMCSLSPGPKSESEPDPEDSPYLKLERSEIHSQFEKLKSENVDLRRENESLKLELANMKEKKMHRVSEVATQTDEVGRQQTRQLETSTSPSAVLQEGEGPESQSSFYKALQDSLSSRFPSSKKDPPLGRSWSMKELQSPLSVSNCLGSSTRSSSPGSPLLKTNVRGRSHSPVRSTCAGSSWTVASSEPPSSPAASLSAQSPDTYEYVSVKSLVTSDALPPTGSPMVQYREEYVQYHAEPMEGGWREFYRPRSIHKLAMMSSGQDQSRRSLGSPGTPFRAVGPSCAEVSWEPYAATARARERKERSLRALTCN